MHQLNPQGQHCPYLIVAAFPKRMPQIIGRTYKRADAEAHMRFLQRRMTQGTFYLVYDPEPIDKELSLNARQRPAES